MNAIAIVIFIQLKLKSHTICIYIYEYNILYLYYVMSKILIVECRGKQNRINSKNQIEPFYFGQNDQLFNQNGLIRLTFNNQDIFRLI